MSGGGGGGKDSCYCKKKKEIVVSMYTKKGKPRIYTEGGGEKHLEQNTRPLQNITSKQKVS